MRSDLSAFKRSPNDRSSFQEKVPDVAEAIDDRAGVTASRRRTEEAEYPEIGDVLLLQP
ncbi:hypothetical protein DPMN_107112 [Dreissena polymorpha]|uniref:Uncharacterized protein n=1 Tax=Dreissena polymorpha TaxID=45954 RepID=A0A9D4K690_DREPO|nr:hypothetical protein DPMN_107112 [Dreissena polymorpha]